MNKNYKIFSMRLKVWVIDMALVYILLVVLFVVLCVMLGDYLDDVKKQQQHDELTKNYQKLYKSWSHK